MNKYSRMQKEYYEMDAARWSIYNKDPVVGSFDAHNNWEDYDVYLFKDINLSNASSCIDFGCGPGRNIVKYNNLFTKFDGVDISKNNLENAKTWISYNKLNASKTSLYLCNGYDLENVPSETYDVVMSTISLQHICVYDIRKKYFEEFFRILKNGGTLTFQMGFGFGHPNSSGYYENKYDAVGTNSACDVRVDNVSQLEGDMEEIGFKEFKHYIRPTGPGDTHENWIFFNCKKKEII